MKKFRKIIVIAGKISSGKTTVSKILSERLKYPYISVSSYLKSELSNRNKPIKRETLQKIGQEIYLKFGEDYIIEKTLAMVANTGNVCIVDGVRYPEGIDILKKYATKCLTIYLDFTSTIRQSRYNEKISLKKWEKIDNSQTELNIEKILEKSELVFRGDFDCNAISDEIINYIDSINSFQQEIVDLTLIGKGVRVLAVGQVTEDHYCELESIPKNNQFSNVTSETITYGGNATNAAFCFSKLGCETHLFSQTSEDFPGELLQEIVNDSINVNLLTKTATSYPRCYMYFKGEDSYNYYSFNGSFTHKEIQINLDNYDIIYISGPEIIIKNFLGNIKKSNLKQFICWNPGYEARFLSFDTINELLKYTNLVIINNDEYNVLSEVLSRKIFEKSLQAIIVTKGSQGSKLITPDMQIIFPSINLFTIANAFGSGDTYSASFALSFYTSRKEINSMKFATTMTRFPLTSKTSRF